MKAKLQVGRGTSTALIKELARAIEEATGLEVPFAERQLKDGQYFLAIDSKSASRMGNILELAVTAIEQALAKKGLCWERLEEAGKGRTYPRPLSETAEAYKSNEEIEEHLEEMARLGISPLKSLVSQEFPPD